MCRLYLTDKKGAFYSGKKVAIPLYPANLCVGIDDDLGESAAITQCVDRQIWVVFEKDYVSDVGKVAHEAVHVIEFLEEIVGDTFVGEARAYLMEWFVKKIIFLLDIQNK